MLKWHCLKAQILVSLHICRADNSTTRADRNNFFLPYVDKYAKHTILRPISYYKLRKFLNSVIILLLSCHTLDADLQCIVESVIMVQSRKYFQHCTLYSS
uniref:Putative secreted protein n=1 Tax=Ixodes ricinus TaxID=34613 RepID=A0A6B0U618_IXORI